MFKAFGIINHARNGYKPGVAPEPPPNKKASGSKKPTGNKVAPIVESARPVDSARRPSR